MLQAYSTGLAITANTAVPFNNVIIDKGCAERLTAPATIELDKRGVYLVEVDGFATGGAAGANTMQLYMNGVALPQAVSSFTASTTAISDFGFKTLIQVSENNCNCNCFTSPTVLQLRNGDVDLTDVHANIVVTKIC